MSDEKIQPICPGCDGKRVQVRATDGIKVICPVCDGTGVFSLKAIMTGLPIPEPITQKHEHIFPPGTIVRGTRG